MNLPVKELESELELDEGDFITELGPGELSKNTLQEDQMIRTFASAGKNSDLLRVPLPAAMFDVNWKNLKFY